MGTQACPESLHCAAQFIEEFLRHTSSCVVAVQIVTSHKRDVSTLQFVCRQPWTPLMFKLLSDTTLTLQNQWVLGCQKAEQVAAALPQSQQLSCVSEVLKHKRFDQRFHHHIRCNSVKEINFSHIQLGYMDSSRATSACTAAKIAC